ncbi:thioredoxin family protein [Candidatus Saccharibacteria bacterium]|nr:thioredoxin family protein [Candidatus Saccharibacteria bacterium]
MKVLKFGAVWCPGCLIMKPRWAEIEKENPWLKTEYFDFDEDKKAVSDYNITDKLPTFVFLDNQDNELFRLSGEISKDRLLQLIEQNKDK